MLCSAALLLYFFAVTARANHMGDTQMQILPKRANLKGLCNRPLNE